jgi:hypothetical protein
VVVEALRLGGEHARRRMARLHGERDARGEAAARGAHQHHVGRKPARGKVLDDLAAGGPLPSDDQRIIVRRHQHGAATLRNVARDSLAVFPLAVVEYDLGAERGGALALGPRRIARHDDHGRHVEQLGGGGDALGVVARREGNDAAGAALGRNRGDLVVRAAELERPSALQGLGL